MEETPHLVAHFMAVGAEKRLEDYHFLRNTYETITGQEIQLNRILRMLGEDEICLSWRLDLSPIGRSRSRSLCNFERWTNSSALQGSIAYERLRDLEDTSKTTKLPTIPSSSRRVQEIRERRQRLSEQREFPSGFASGSGGGGGAPSSSRLRALAEYETSLTESDAKRQRQADEKRLNTLKNEEKDVPERKREKFKTTFADDQDSSAKTKQQEDESSHRLSRKISLREDQDKNAVEDQEGNADKVRKSSTEYKPDKSGDIELISFTVRCQAIPSSNNEEGEDNSSVRLLCQWASPSSSSAISYYTIERQQDDSEWLPIGEKIDKLKNQTQLDIPSSNENTNDEDINTNVPSYFRLKAHLQNGQTFTSKPTDGIFLNLAQEKKIIIPEVEILSPSSVELTWKDNDNEESKNEENQDIYDIEKKEDEQTKWEKVTEVPLSQRSARIDSLTDAKQCQFRLVSTSTEPDETEKPNTINTVVDSDDQVPVDEFAESSTGKKVTFSDDEMTPDEAAESSKKNVVTSLENQDTGKETTKHGKNNAVTSLENQDTGKETTKHGKKNAVTFPDDEVPIDEATETSKTNAVTSLESEDTGDETTKHGKKNAVTFSDNQAAVDEDTESSKKNAATSSEDQLAVDESATSENEDEPEETTEPENEAETEVLTVNNVNEWLSSLHVAPTSSNTVDVDISEEGFKDFDSYKVEYTTDDRLDRWKQVSDITRDDPHLTIDNLKQGTDYKFRFTPVTSDETTADETNSSQLSLVLDVRMPSARKGRFTQDESETPVAIPPKFSIQKLDSSTVLIEAVVPADEPATFEDVYDVFSKKETNDVDEDDWTKVGTIDKEHLSTTVEDLEENTAYAFKIDSITSPSDDQESNTVQEFKFDTKPVKQYDPSLFLEKIEQSLEKVVNGVMQAAAGHQVLEEPLNKSLNEVIKEVFRDESLVPNEEYGFDTLALNTDLQVYRGPKQMMLKELEVDETTDSSKHYGEIIIHNYRTSQQSVIVREENGNTRVANIDGDIIIRNVVSDVILRNEQTHHQLSMNIVGQAFLKGVQGTLIASKFKGIIVVKSVNKP